MTFHALCEDLFLLLAREYNLKDVCETGTYYGETAVWASSHFEHVVTIEYSRTIYEKTIARHGDLQNIEFVFGDSKEVIKNLIPKLNRPAIFWLDSHWSGGETCGEQDECPLLQELQAIIGAGYPHFIFIDDARLFLSPPPKPHKKAHWPAIDEVIGVLKSGNHKHYIVIIEDIVIAVPEYAKDLVADYCQERNTLLWYQTMAKTNRSTIFQKAKALIGYVPLLLKRV